MTDRSPDFDEVLPFAAHPVEEPPMARPFIGPLEPFVYPVELLFPIFDEESWQ